MTFTYDDPNSSDLESVRYKIGDTDSDNPQLTDEEIEYELAEANSSILLAAARCASALAARYARKVTKKIGDRSINYSDLAAQYRSLAADLESQHQQGAYSGYSVPDIGKVADVENYPVTFEPSDVGQPAWGEE